MKEQKGKTEDGQEVDRRRFIEFLAVLGATSLVAQGCSPPPPDQVLAGGPADSLAASGPSHDATQGITVEAIKAAEEIIGIELTEPERGRILDGLRENLAGFLELRGKDLGAADFPAVVFNPIPPGYPIPSEKKPIHWGRIATPTPAKVEDCCFHSILQLADLLRSRRATSVDLTKMYLARLKKHDPDLQFVVNLTEELALEQAERADAEIASGDYRGPLHGIPYGIKDLFSVKRYPTTWGAGLFRDRVIQTDASVVRKLEQAGAVLVAKLATGTLASGEEWFGGTTRNPWRPSRPSGGSSGGPASAAAAGCVGFSVGTETNGSMVSPCAECGVTGLRPTFGRVSRFGAMTTSWSFDKVTPICRTAEDCAVVLDAIQGPDEIDNSVLDVPFNWDPDLAIDKLRIGYHARFFEKELMNNPQSDAGIQLQEATRSHARSFLRLLEGKGVKLVPLDFQLDHSSEGIMMLVEAAAAHDEFTRGTQDDGVSDQKWPDYHRMHRFVPAVEYLQAARYRSRIIHQMHEAIKDVDLFVEITWSNNWSTNETGLPIVVVPCGQIDGWRPVTVTLVGNLFREAEILAVARAFQNETDHHLMHPPL